MDNALTTQKELKWYDIFSFIKENRDSLQKSSDLFFSEVMKPARKEYQNRKLALSSFEHAINDHFNPSNEIQKISFRIFLSSDLHNMNKFFLVDDTPRGFYFSSSDHLVHQDIHSGRFSHIITSFRDVAMGEINSTIYRRGHWFLREVECSDFPEVFGVDYLSEIVNSGFFEFIKKKNVSKKEGFPQSVNNKMSFMIWKKMLLSKPITGLIFKESLTSIRNNPEFLTKGILEYSKIDSLVGRQYFKDGVMSIWGLRKYDCGTFHSEKISRIKIKQLNDYKEGDWHDDELIYWIESVSSPDNSKEFVSWVISQPSFNKIRFQNGANSLFTRENYINHLHNLFSV